MTHTTANVQNIGFRAYADDVAGGITSQTALFAADTNWTQAVDTTFHVAMRVAEVNGGDANNYAYSLQYNLNSTGWADVTTTTPIQAATATNCTTADNASYGTTALSNGATIQATEYCNNADAANNVSLNNAAFEKTSCLTIDSAQVADSDTIQLRLTNNGTALDADTTIPTITVSEAAANTNVPLDAGSFAVAGHSLVASLASTLDAGAFTITGYSGNESFYIPPATGSFALTGFDATASTVATTDVPLDAGSYALTGFAANSNLSVAVEAGSYALTGLSATVDVGQSVVLDAGSFALAGFDASLSVADNTLLSLDAGSYAVAGQSLSASVLAALDAGSYTWVGFDTAIETAGVTPVPLDAGLFTLTGYSGNEAFYLEPSPGGFAIAGYDATVVDSIDVLADAGSYALSGLDAAVTMSIAADAGSFSLTGLDSSLGVSLALSAGSFALAGFDATAVVGGSIIPLDAGSFVLTGYSGNESFYIPPGAGSFSLSGYETTLILTGPVTVPLDGGTYTLSGLTMSVGAGLGDIDGALNTGTDPDSIAYTTTETFTGTVFLVITDSATPPALQGTPAGFADAGLWNDSLSITGSTGSDTFTIPSSIVGDYYLHTVGYRTSDGAFTTVDSDAITVPMTLEGGSFALTGLDPVLGDQVDLRRGTFALTGYGVEIPQGAALVEADASAFVLSGFGFTFSFDAVADAGSFSIIGLDADVRLSVETTVSIDAGTYTLTGFDTVVSARVPLSHGQFSVAGFPLTLGMVSQLPGGAFGVSGFDVDASIGEPLEAGAFSLSGFGAEVSQADVIYLDAATFSVTGRDTLISALGIYQLDGTALVMTGFAATLGQSLGMASGSFAVTGFNFPISLAGQSSRRVAMAANSSSSGIPGDSAHSGTFDNDHNSGIVSRG